MSETGLKTMMRALMVCICKPNSPLVAGWSPSSHTSRMLSYPVCVVDMLAGNLGKNSRLAARNLSLGANSRSCSCSRSEKPGEPGESRGCAGNACMCEVSRECDNSRPQNYPDRDAQ
jgi:hypothetical protein